MFTYRNTTILFFIFLIILIVLSITGTHIPFFVYLLLVLFYIGISVAISFVIGSGFHMKVICRKETEFRVIALTFDDGPDPMITPKVLDILQDKASATFFCIGRKVIGNEPLIRRMEKEGHLIGTHSFSHSNWFDLYSAKRMKKEFVETETAIQKIIGKRPLLFRPPYGVINPMVKKALRGLLYHVIGFSNRALDTVTKDPEKALQRVMDRLKPGDIVLFHDTVSFIPDLLINFLKKVSEKGFIIINLDQLLNVQPYE